MVTEREIETIVARAAKDNIEEGGIWCVSYTKTKGWTNCTSDEEKDGVGTIFDETRDRESIMAESCTWKWSYGVIAQ